MHNFQYSEGKLHCEGVAVQTLARKYGTPMYVYSQATLTKHFQRLEQAMAPLDHLICFAVKSNSNLSVLRILSNLGSGFDIVSGGELHRVLSAGGDPRKCAFAGVGKSAEEIEYALRQGVYTFNAESEPELERIDRIAGKLKKTAPVAVRVNPNVEAGTHKKITTGTYENKFGIAFEEVEGVYERASKLKHLRLRGIQMHIGSQITDVTPFEQAVKKVLPLIETLKAEHPLEFFSVGGGLGIVYKPALESGDPNWWTTGPGAKVITPEKYAAKLVPLLQKTGLKILMEPGRFISGNAGALVTKVEYVKHTGNKNFVIVDAAMNDLIRPAFYDAYHEIVPLNRKGGVTVNSDVVGPICESGDFFCHDRPLPKLREGDYICLLSAGAYGAAMGSNYNTRPLPVEILVNGRSYEVIRERQQIPQVWAGEKIAPWLKKQE